MADQQTQKKDTSKTNVDGELENPNTKNNMNDEPSTSADYLLETHNDSVASSSEHNDEEYHIGDIVWAKIGKYPFWPSIVCCDPDTKIFMRGSPKDKKKFSLHVRFCYDNGRRSWAKILNNYSGKNDLLSKYPNCLSFMKNSKKQMNTWNLAVKEADSWLKFDREERWLRFSTANNIKSPVTTPIKSSATATVSNKPPDDTITTNTDSTTQKVPDCYIYLNKLSDGQIQKEDLRKRKIIKKKIIKDKITNPLNNLSFTCSEQNYQIDDNNDKPLNPPTHRRRRVLDRMRFDVEKLEAEGIQKIREWKASKLAKAARSNRL